MIDDKIINLARKINPKTEPTDISLLQGGFSSQAYKVDVNNEPFVLVVERTGSVSNSGYGHAFLVLTLLKSHKYPHAPEPIWLAEDHQAMAMSYFDGQASNEFDFSHVDSENLAIKVMDSLLDTADITLDEYNKLAQELNIEHDPVQTVQEAVRRFGVEWLEVAKESCSDQGIINWLEPRVERSIQLSKKLGNHKPTFSHGDPSDPNILIKQNGEFMLIDWDSAAFLTTGPEFLIAYIRITEFMAPHTGTLINHVAERLNISRQEFSQRVAEYRKYEEVFDVNWAAMMMAKVNSGAIEGDIEHFRGLAWERINKYDKNFGTIV